jgi:hypothetical protein
MCARGAGSSTGNKLRVVPLSCPALPLCATPCPKLPTPTPTPSQLVAVRKKFGQSLEVLREYQTRIVDLETAASAAKAALQDATARHASVVDAHAVELRALNDAVCSARAGWW